ncbi:SHOCT domain-containing protein [Terrabacter sp. NPDC080008]|uniref:SHOCT domain-containing protein n=1 Tax=Terrabacter sp. NPDC080008 TaxID=3155176 RepID=UPI00344E71A1
MNFWSWFWLLVWTFFFVAYLIMLFHIFSDLFRDRELGGLGKVAWVVALLVVPLLSALVYLVVRGRGMAERQMERTVGREKARQQAVGGLAVGDTWSPTDELTQAKSLFDNGALTPEEYSQIKARALS